MHMIRSPNSPQQQARHGQNAQANFFFACLLAEVQTTTTRRPQADAVELRTPVSFFMQHRIQQESTSYSPPPPPPPPERHQGSKVSRHQKTKMRDIDLFLGNSRHRMITSGIDWQRPRPGALHDPKNKRFFPLGQMQQEVQCLHRPSPQKFSSSPVNHPAQAPQHISNADLVTLLIRSIPPHPLPAFQRIRTQAQNIVRNSLSGTLECIQSVHIICELVDLEFEIVIDGLEAGRCGGCKGR